MYCIAKYPPYLKEKSRLITIKECSTRCPTWTTISRNLVNAAGRHGVVLLDYAIQTLASSCKIGNRFVATPCTLGQAKKTSCLVCFRCCVWNSTHLCTVSAVHTGRCNNGRAMARGGFLRASPLTSSCLTGISVAASHCFGTPAFSQGSRASFLEWRARTTLWWRCSWL